MSEERNIDPFSLLILVLSIIAIITEIIGPFAGFFLTGYSNRFSCLDCEYSTSVDLISILNSNIIRDSNNHCFKRIATK
ncbi:MAG: hypothetical protein CEE42_11740 [Promethearchaeota archaeon Loki_b31]|nr:MAG: hypothetical protein CEE42_11740 [Candidatus Lokiarchaeota archaeon Loki_b31]